MENIQYTMKDLFDQLGLPSDERAIEKFIRKHRHLDPTIPLEQAKFWNDAQAAFLHDAIQDDSDWCELVDHLDAQLRH